ncbi:MAG: hypothetical protein AAFR77_11910 [Cyanobacteria bacterium J06631_2]
MKVYSFNKKPLSAQEIEHLEKIKNVVEKSLENGKLSIYEMEHIKSMIWANGKVNYERLSIFRKTVKEVMGDIEPEIEWQSNR